MDNQEAKTNPNLKSITGTVTVASHDIFEPHEMYENRLETERRAGSSLRVTLNRCVQMQGDTRTQTHADSEAHCSRRCRSC